MKYKLYTNSQAAWGGMFKAMSQAQNSIYLEMYIFLSNTQKTHNFLNLLKAKARGGLEIVIIVDSFGSRSLKRKVVQEMEDLGIEFIYFSHWFRHTHRKILIIDKRVAFIGGVNIQEKSRAWKDLQIRLEGRIVKPVLKSFAYGYQTAGGKKESILKFSRQPLVKKIKSWIIDTFASKSKIYNLNNYYKKKISGAQKSIIIVTPYLLPPRWLFALLDNASQRGVEIEILIPNDTDVKSLNKINYLNSCRLAEFGVKFYLLPVMNHAKIMLIDSEEGVIGSPNMDVLSFNFNIEVGVFFRQKKLVYDVQKIIEKWKRDSLHPELSQRKLKVFDRLLMFILKLFYKLF